MVDTARRASVAAQEAWSSAASIFHAVSAVVVGIAQTVAKEKVFAPLRDALGAAHTTRREGVEREDERASHRY